MHPVMQLTSNTARRQEQGLLTLLYENSSATKLLLSCVDVDGKLPPLFCKRHMHLADHAYEAWQHESYNGYRASGCTGKRRLFDLIRNIMNYFTWNSGKNQLTDSDCIAYLQHLDDISVAVTYSSDARDNFFDPVQQWFGTNTLVFVSPSTITNAGMGLFARSRLQYQQCAKKPFVLSLFWGKWTKNQTQIDRAVWSIEATGGWCHVHSDVPKRRVEGLDSAASFANDITLNSLTRASGHMQSTFSHQNNMRISGGTVPSIRRNGSAPYVMLTKTVNAGQELCVGYGKTYKAMLKEFSLQNR